jgi:hypothetical protein
MVAKMKLWLLHLVSEPAVGKLEPMGQIAKFPFAQPATKHRNITLSKRKELAVCRNKYLTEEQ